MSPVLEAAKAAIAGDWTALNDIETKLARTGAKLTDPAGLLSYDELITVQNRIGNCQPLVSGPKVYGFTITATGICPECDDGELEADTNTGKTVTVNCPICAGTGKSDEAALSVNFNLGHEITLVTRP